MRESDVAEEIPLVTRFNSSAIESARYHRDTRILDIWYEGGDLYSYFDVPFETYAELRKAPSAGQYVNGEIKPHYRHELEPARKRFRPD